MNTQPTFYGEEYDTAIGLAINAAEANAHGDNVRDMAALHGRRRVVTTIENLFRANGCVLDVGHVVLNLKHFVELGFMWSGPDRSLQTFRTLMLSTSLRAIYYDAFDAAAVAYALELAKDHDEIRNITARYFAIPN